MDKIIEVKVKNIAKRIRTDAISHFILKTGTNYVAWVDGDETRWGSAVGNTRAEAKENLIEEIIELMDMEEGDL